ncbi:hypothetical protein DFQ26_007541 [Actinomortierella ambigua]|nr:hypothetical protein DFQ26_007541 [Actinomortierella ambigua]
MPPKKSLATQDTKSNKKQKIGDSDAGSVAHDSRSLTKEEEEEMSSALIAQLLAQEGGGGDHGYYAEYNNDYQRYGDVDMSDEDEDYWDGNYRPKSKSRAKKAKPRPKKKAAKPTPPKAAIATAEPAPVTPTTTTTTTTTTATNTTTVAVTPAAPTEEPAKSVATAVVETSTTIPAEEANQLQQTISEPEPASAPTPELASAPTPAPAPKPAIKEKKLPKEMAPGINTGTYSEEEERRFVEALEIFGRDWPKVEEHVRTRDANSIRSHAQKHFIKLFRDNVPLPPKILETGPGYTLSGRDLDPYSAAARPYLSQRLLDDPSLLPAQSGTQFSPPDPSNPQPKKSKEKPAKATESIPSHVKDKDKGKDKEKDKEKEERSPKESSHKESRPTRTRAARESSRNMDVDLSPPSRPAGRTDYSKARLRSVRERTSIHYNQMANSDLDPLTMVKCEPFCGKPNSGVTGCQPFTITVRSNVLLGMDFHAHLMTTEIIGFLAGTWDRQTKTIDIQANFPCRSLPTGQNHVNVEMDPTSEFEVRQEIEKRNMRIVGWYHSHPTFTPDPSLVDIENQTSYQRLFKDEAMNEEPFVGAIVGKIQAAQERGQPKRLIYDLAEDTSLPEEDASHWLKLVDEYRDSPERVNFAEQWRQGESETNLQKLLVSLGRRMPWLRDQLKREQADRQKEEADEVEQQKKNLEVEGNNHHNHNHTNNSASATTTTSSSPPPSGEAIVPSEEVPNPESVPKAESKAEEQVAAIIAGPAEDVEMTEASEASMETVEQSQVAAATQDSELAEATSAIAIDSNGPQDEVIAGHGDQQSSETVLMAPTASTTASNSSEKMIADTVPELKKDDATTVSSSPTAQAEATEEVSSMERDFSTPTDASISSAMMTMEHNSSSLSSCCSRSLTPFEGGVAMSRTGSNVSRESLISIGSESSGRQLVVASLKLRGILQDEFLVRVEQELSTWEPFLG